MASLLPSHRIIKITKQLFDIPIMFYVFPPGTHSPEIAPGSLPVATLYLNRLSPHPWIMYPRWGATLSFIAILQVALK